MKSIFLSHPFRFLLALLLVLSSCEEGPAQQVDEPINEADIIPGISLYGIPESEIIAGESPSFDIAVSLSGEAAKRFSVGDVHFLLPTTALR